jgi:hypothetical protein
VEYHLQLEKAWDDWHLLIQIVQRRKFRQLSWDFNAHGWISAIFWRKIYDIISVAKYKPFCMAPRYCWITRTRLLSILMALCIPVRWAATAQTHLLVLCVWKWYLTWYKYCTAELKMMLSKNSYIELLQSYHQMVWDWQRDLQISSLPLQSETKHMCDKC